MIFRASSIRIILWDRLYLNQPVRPNGALPDMAHRHLHLFNTSLVTLVLFSALVGCTEEAAESRFTYSQNAGVSVVTEPAKLTDLVETLTSVGTARALQSVNVFQTRRVVLPPSISTLISMWIRATYFCNWMTETSD